MSAADKELCERIEHIVRPIVEGQIRGFLKEHPAIVDAVDWYKPRRDKATTFVNSLAKRIVRDLASGNVAGRLAAVALEVRAEAPRIVICGTATADDSGARGIRTARPAKDNTPSATA